MGTLILEACSTDDYFSKRFRSLNKVKAEVKAKFQSSRRLTNLSVSNADETLVHKFVSLRVPGLPLHDVTLCSLIG